MTVSSDILGNMPCGLYLHIPFCETKCGYCDFYSIPVAGRATAPLAERVGRELRARVGSVPPGRVRTIFCGGGTPTILPLDQLAGLLGEIREAVAMESIEEFTVEANPATVDDQKARTIVEAGVTRVSMGAQSFFPAELATLERLHTPDDIAPSVATLRRNAVQQVNLDLIFGIPGQTMDTWDESLRRAIDLGPDHLACYGLTYEPATKLTAQLNAGRVTPCDEDLEADLYLHMIDTLEAAGFHQYEISNFAKAGCECRHNLIYWRNQPYIGAGPSAAGCIDGRRYKNVPDAVAYVRMIDEQGHAEVESELIEGEALMHELILMQLRLNEGLSIAGFRARTGADPVSMFGVTLTNMVEHGWLSVSSTHIALTRKGRLVANRIINELAGAIPDQGRGVASAGRAGS